MTNQCLTPSGHLLSLDGLEEKQVLKIFSRSEKLRAFFLTHGKFPQSLPESQVTLLFSEPSTRTKVSFQMAAQRLGAQTLVFDVDGNSSAKKGESAEDTLATIVATKPSAIVLRCGEDWDLSRWVSSCDVPILCGGWGKKSHPTQALLDMFTLYEKWGASFTQRKLLFFGDLKHSRVFASHRVLAKILGHQLGVVAPEAWLPENSQSLQVFDNFEKALHWADAVYGLRVQRERHDPADKNTGAGLKSCDKDSTSQSQGNSNEDSTRSGIKNAIKTRAENNTAYDNNVARLENNTNSNRVSDPHNSRESDVKNPVVGDLSRGYQLTADHLSQLRPDQWILHPGPVNWGVEFALDVKRDPRNLLARQVENGVFVRAVLLEILIKGLE